MTIEQTISTKLWIAFMRMVGKSLFFLVSNSIVPYGNNSKILLEKGESAYWSYQDFLKTLNNEEITD